MRQLPEQEVGVVRGRALGSQEMSFKLKKVSYCVAPPTG